MDGLSVQLNDLSYDNIDVYWENLSMKELKKVMKRQLEIDDILNVLMKNEIQDLMAKNFHRVLKKYYN